MRADGRGPETRTFFYYAGYGVENGDFEGFDLNYLMVRNCTRCSTS